MSSVLADRKINIDDIHPDASKYISSPGAREV
jgi:hypothetical protein